MNTMKPAPVHIVAIVGCGLAAFSYARTIKAERAKRREIERNKNLDIAAIRRATATMKARVENGDYDHKSLHDVLTDLSTMNKFEKIAIRIDL